MKRWTAAFLLMTTAYAQSNPGAKGIDAAKDKAVPLPAGRRGAAPPAATGAGRVAAPADAAPAAPPKAAPSSSGLTAAKELKYPPLRPILQPAISSFALSNGMRISLLEDHDLPLVSGMAIVKTGSLLDSPQRIGLAQLTAIALRTGGSNIKTPEQVDILLEDNAANIEVAIPETMATMSFGSLKENAEATLQVFRELLAQPGFRPEKIEIAKAQLRDGIAQRNDVQRTLTRREFAGLIYGKDNPYGWQPEYGTLGNVQRVSVR